MKKRLNQSLQLIRSIWTADRRTRDIDTEKKLEAAEKEIARLTSLIDVEAVRSAERERRLTTLNDDVDWISRYMAWSQTVFGQRIAPIIDTSVKAVVSFPTGSPYYEIAAASIFESELACLRDLLTEINKHNVEGHFAEFGVFEGAWINRLYDMMAEAKLAREIWGFDSFRGLSAPDPARDHPFWKEGMYAAGFDEVAALVHASDRPQVKLIAGFFSESLPSPAAQELRSVCLARIDCDIYGPTVDCLRFLGSRLSHGSVLVFDDWSHNIDHGEARAFAEWTPTVPHLEFEFLFYGVWDHLYMRVWHRGLKRLPMHARAGTPT